MSKKGDFATFQLAVMRTELANSTTMLSHTQASIGLFLSGLGFIKFFDSSAVFDWCGWFFILLSACVLTRGLLLYRKTQVLIKTEKGDFTGALQG